MHHAKMPAGHLVPRDAPVGHRRGNNPVEYVIIFFIFVPRDAPVGHRRGNNPVEYVFIFFRVMPLWGIDAVTIRLSMLFFFCYS